MRISVPIIAACSPCEGLLNRFAAEKGRPPPFFLLLGGPPSIPKKINFFFPCFFRCFLPAFNLFKKYSVVCFRPALASLLPFQLLGFRFHRYGRRPCHTHQYAHRPNVSGRIRFFTIGAVGSVYPGEPLGLEVKMFSYHWTHLFLFQIYKRSRQAFDPDPYRCPRCSVCCYYDTMGFAPRQWFEQPKILLYFRIIRQYPRAEIFDIMVLNRGISGDAPIFL